MARKGTELKTKFTGDDTNLQRTIARNIKDADRVGTEWEKSGKKGKMGISKLNKELDETSRKSKKAASGLNKMKGAAAAVAVAGAAITKQTTGLVDNLVLSKSSGATFEQFQALAATFKIFRIEADDTREIIVELARAIGEAKLEAGEGTKTTVFKEMGIDIEAFDKLDPIGRVLALSDAMSKLQDKDKALANLGMLLGDDVSARFKFPLEMGPEKLLDTMSSVPVVSERAAMEAMEDERTARKIGKEGAGLLNGAINTILGRQSFKDFGRRTMAAMEQSLESARAATVEPVFKAAAGNGLMVEALEASKKNGGSNAFKIPALMGRTVSGSSAGSQFPALDAMEKLQGEQIKTSKKQLTVAEKLVETAMRFEQVLSAEL